MLYIIYGEDRADGAAEIRQAKTPDPIDPFDRT